MLLGGGFDDKEEEDSRVGDDFGSPKGEGADGELKNLEPLGGVFVLEIGCLRSVDGQDSVPRRRVRTGSLQRHGDEVGAVDVVLDLIQCLREI